MCKSFLQVTKIIFHDCSTMLGNMRIMVGAALFRSERIKLYDKPLLDRQFPLRTIIKTHSQLEKNMEVYLQPAEYSRHR